MLFKVLFQMFGKLPVISATMELGIFHTFPKKRNASISESGTALSSSIIQFGIIRYVPVIIQQLDLLRISGRVHFEVSLTIW